MKLVLATGNAYKVKEIRQLLNVPGLELLTLADIPEAPDVVEDGDTFEANAIKKAVALARHAGLPALADDSGLEVDALDGAPGVYSARYAGPEQDDRANLDRLLEALREREDRAGRFRCVIAYAEPDGETRTVEGACEGAIAREPRGDGGFGYDPVFVPDGYDRTFAEMSADEKHALSHRGRALRRAMEAWAGEWAAA